MRRAMSQRTESIFKTALDKAAELESSNAKLSGVHGREDSLSPPHIYRIVITGGPCAGKTSAIAMLRGKLENAGWRVFTVPEASSLLFLNGASHADFARNGIPGMVNFQAQLANLQMKLESTMYDMAEASGHKSVILNNRGLMDGKAYIPHEDDWATVLDTVNLSESQARERRYDAVVHLVTCAEGASEFYQLRDNAQTIRAASDLDKRVCQAWVGHPHMHIIDNSTSFEQKVNRVTQRVFKVIGEEVQVGLFKKKFKIPYQTPEELAVTVQSAGAGNPRIVACEIIWTSPTTRIIKRSDDESATFYWETFRDVDGKLMRSLHQQIGSDDYARSHNEATAAGHKTLKKMVVSFMWERHIYMVNVYRRPEPVCVVEVEAEDDMMDLPPFLKESGFVIDVTHEHKYQTGSRAFVGYDIRHPTA